MACGSHLSAFDKNDRDLVNYSTRIDKTQHPIYVVGRLSRHRITARLRRDAEQHARSVKETLEAEYSGRLVAALEKNEESQAGAATAQDKVTRLGEWDSSVNNIDYTVLLYDIGNYSKQPFACRV